MWEVSLIELLQSASSPFLDGLIYLITMMGDEVFFMVLAVMIFWCVDKRFAFKFMTVYILSAAVNEGLKNVIMRDRPYIAHPQRIDSIKTPTEGYSFPSGHSNGAANIATQLSLRYGRSDRKWVYYVSAVLTLLVMFSRLYLGQHYLTDVLGGAALGILSALFLNYLFELLKQKEEYLVFALMPVLILLAIFLPTEKVHTIAGAYSAVSAGYYIEKKYIKADVRGTLIQHIIKCLIGISVALAIKEGLKLILPEDISFLHNFLRYFLIGIWASIIMPLIIKKWFNKSPQVSVVS